MESTTPAPEFPPLTRADVLNCQFSSWYPTFEKITIKSVVIKPLPSGFREYLEADSVTLPEGSEAIIPSGDLSDDEAEGPDTSESFDSKTFSFPDLDVQIRRAIARFDSVFPKLNWTSPQDASWILAPSSPLKCTSPADVYLFLKSSDFISHDLDPNMVFEGCVDEQVASPPSTSDYALELVLKKWYVMEKSRELRCFVRDGILLGITQRDSNFYEYLNEDGTRNAIRDAVIKFFKEKIQNMWLGGSHYIFDVLLTRDLERAHLIDINPYAPRTDPLLFTYAALAALATTSSEPSFMPEFRVIPSRAHPSAARTSPQNAHNMVPRELLDLSAGRNILDFQSEWSEELKRAMEASESESDEAPE